MRYASDTSLPYPLFGFALYDEQFAPTAHGQECIPFHLVSDFERLLESRVEGPDLLVVDAPCYQLEVIFAPQTLTPATITLLTKVGTPADRSGLFRALHPNEIFHGDHAEELAQWLLRQLCQTQLLWEVTDGDTSEGLWRQHNVEGGSL